MTSVVESNQHGAHVMTKRRADDLKIKAWIQGNGLVVDRPKILSDIERTIKPVVLPPGFGCADHVAYMLDDRLMHPFRKGWIVLFRPSTLDECLNEFCLATLEDGQQYFKVLRRTSWNYSLEHLSPIYEPMNDVKIAAIMIMDLVTPNIPVSKRSD